MNSISLTGCTPEPLMGYLKALGVFRLVSEQIDPQARAAWKDGCLVLHSTLDDEGLISFFHEKYEPTPVFSPWNQEGGFLSETGAGAAAVKGILNAQNPRLRQLQKAIKKIESMSILTELASCRTRLKELKKAAKSKLYEEEIKQQKAREKHLKETLVYQIRSEFPNESLGWFDACIQVGADGFSVAPSLGSGGVDGRMEFSVNFLGNLLLVLEHGQSAEWAKGALLGKCAAPLLSSSIGQFAPGSVGGPNATHGFEGSSWINPWDFILLIEGTPLLAGAVSRRCDSQSRSRSAFPFTVSALVQDGDSLQGEDGASSRGELWLPLWHKASTLSEISQLFGEGRSEWSGKRSRTSVDFSKAAASFGVDRGVASFSRHAFLQRNGRSFLAAPVGRFDVRARRHVDLLQQSDPWIERFRRACTDKSPARFHTALRRIDSTVFAYCRFGGTDRFQAILIALGQAEREVANGKKFRIDANTGRTLVPPLSGLSSGWLDASNDDSEEFEIAAALAGIRGVKGKLPGIRVHLESVAFGKNGKLDWADDSPLVVWNSADLERNLAAVLSRRLIDSERLGLPSLPIFSPRGVSLRAIADFLGKGLDARKIEDLLWGLIACQVKWTPSKQRDATADAPPPLPRFYGLLKLNFHGGDAEDPRLGPKMDSDFWDKLTSLVPDPRVLKLLLANQPEEAGTLMQRRLRGKNLSPANISLGENLDASGNLALAAALLFPVSRGNIGRLWKLIARQTKESPEDPDDLEQTQPI